MSWLGGATRRLPFSVAIFLFFLAVYGFTLSGMIQYGDEAEKYLVAQSIVERHDFSFRPTVVRNEVGTDGRTFSVYELGTSLLQVPFYILGRVFTKFFPTTDSNSITTLTVGLLNPLLTALACVLLFKSVLRMGYRVRTGVGLTIAFGLATTVFPYAKGFNREPILTILILLLFYTAISFRRTRDRRWLIANGLAAGALVFTKLIQVLVLPLFLFYILTAIFESRAEDSSQRNVGREIAEAIGIFVVPLFLFLGFQIVYSYYRFGTFYGGLGGTLINPLEVILGLSRASNPVETTQRLLFSPEKSIFLYSPPILLFTIAWWKWRSTTRNEAWLALGLVLTAFLSAIMRLEGDTPGWWGARYLVQVTPFFILPIAVLLESKTKSARRFWWSALIMLSTLGFFVQLVGVFTNSRGHWDILGTGATLAGEWEFFKRGAFDSLLLYLSPNGFIQINPFGGLLITVACIFGAAIVFNILREEKLAVPSPRFGMAILGLMVAVQLAAFTVWVIAPYPRVVAARSNTQYLAASRFLADGNPCVANALYVSALYGGTDFQTPAVTRVNQFLGFENDDSFSPADLDQTIESDVGTRVEHDFTMALTNDGALKISAPEDTDQTVFAISRALPVRPQTTYRLSGWARLENVYGAGFASIVIYEDDGNWQSRRSTDFWSRYETSGWQPFWGTITTLPTTTRFILRTGLWKTFGTVWIDDMKLKQMDSPESMPGNSFPSCEIKN